MPAPRPATPVPETVLLGQGDPEAPVLYALAGGTATALSLRCPGVDRPNEDAAAVLPFGERAGALAVADGAGGCPGGERASRLALECLRESFAEARAADRTLRGAILDGFERADRAIADLGIGAGTTLALAEIQDGTLRAYHAGDSVILLVGQRGKVKLETVSHSPVGYAVEAGFLDEAEAMVHEDRHLVSNFVGGGDMRIEIGPGLRIAARDTVVVASDGLTDNMAMGELVEHVRKGPLLDRVAAVAALCRARMQGEGAGGEPPPLSKPDDLSVALYRPGG